VTVPMRSSRRPARPGEGDLRAAWAGVALLPVAFVLAMLTGDALLSAQGYDSGGSGAVPLRAALLAGVPALLILVAPALLAVAYGYRGYRAGREAARVPAWIGAAVGLVALATNALQVIASLVESR
jgi:hypothetical protein